MKKVLAVFAIVLMTYSCTPETDEVYDTTTNQQATDKDDVPSGGDKGSNG